MSKLNIGIAGLGNVGSALVETIEENKNYFFDKTDVELNIVGISARTKNKKRNLIYQIILGMMTQEKCLKMIIVT